MTLDLLISTAKEKTNFLSIDNYICFSKKFLEFIANGLQAIIVSQNENQYRFLQYQKDGNYNISRPINSALMYNAQDFEHSSTRFINILQNIRDLPKDDLIDREVLIRTIYTLQQSIGAVLDALPAGESNRARKVNGDLFERLIQLLIKAMNIQCTSGTVQIPVFLNGVPQFPMSYQHDLLLYNGDELKVIGSVKTSSKDRIGKIFLDKFLYSKLTETSLPHIAIFLNDVQRKPARRENEYSINSTFLSGHFKVFTIKLNPLDGVYYCDIRPNMVQDTLLNQHIRTIDYLFFNDIWRFMEMEGLPLDDVKVEEKRIRETPEFDDTYSIQ